MSGVGGLRRKREVAITGLGVVAPNGVGVKAFWEGSVAGRSGVGFLSRFDATELPVRIAAEVDVHALPSSAPGEPLAHRIALAAASEAMSHSGLGEAEERGPGAVVVAGGSADIVSDLLLEALAAANPEAVGTPSALRHDALAEAVLQQGSAARFGDYAMVPLAPRLGRRFSASQVWTLSTACAGGAQAIRDGHRRVARGEVEWALVGGVDALVTRNMMMGFSQLSALSRRNDDPPSASRPFDRHRDGFVMGEGGAFLVLESAAHARRRGAEVLAWLAGAGVSADAHRLTDPHPRGRGMVLAMQRALADAGLASDAVQYVNAHGTSTVANDRTESAALHEVFAGAPPAVSSIKSMIGHLIHGAGAVEAVASVMALVDQILPPTINHHETDPDCRIDPVPNQARGIMLSAVLSNSFGFGGQNVSLVLRRR
jgi:3-oxoacyl-[acyl-carrier-protein] synthase II